MIKSRWVCLIVTHLVLLFYILIDQSLKLSPELQKAGSKEFFVYLDSLNQIPTVKLINEIAGIIKGVGFVHKFAEELMLIKKKILALMVLGNLGITGFIIKDFRIPNSLCRKEIFFCICHSVLLHPSPMCMTQICDLLN